MEWVCVGGVCVCVCVGGGGGGGGGGRWSQDVVMFILPY